MTIVERLRRAANLGLIDGGLMEEAAAEIERLLGLLTRCETILGNMALENEGAIFNRWPISHEPLRSDARNLLPLIKQAKP